jgi:hypothetical protein
VGRDVFCKNTAHLREQMNRAALRNVELLSAHTDYERAMVNYLGDWFFKFFLSLFKFAINKIFIYF